MIKCIEGGIAGKGLDYGYLSQIKHQADKLGLVGTVFIKEDGSVKVIAEGTDETLEEFAKELKPGHFFSTIENFYTIWSESNTKYTEFSIN